MRVLLVLQAALAVSCAVAAAEPEVYKALPDGKNPSVIGINTLPARSVCARTRDFNVAIHPHPGQTHTFHFTLQPLF